jgi:hypothetical protein
VFHRNINLNNKLVAATPQASTAVLQKSGKYPQLKQIAIRKKQQSQL